jgi:periplasmic divalent cation tolerance protein
MHADSSVVAIQVVTTTAHQKDAERIARALVDRRLAACVQIEGPLQSCYRWQGQIEIAEEWRCCVKTRSDAYPAVEAAIQEMHPYEEPEIVAMRIIAGSPGYLQWLCEQVTTDSSP